MSRGTTSENKRNVFCGYRKTSASEEISTACMFFYSVCLFDLWLSVLIITIVMLGRCSLLWECTVGNDQDKARGLV